MQEKIELEVMGISPQPDHILLALQERYGKRLLLMSIGLFEAQAIAMAMVGMRPPRPMTHDLLKNVLEKFNHQLKEVVIVELSRDGTFYADLVFADNNTVDARPSDAIALAVRYNAPIFAVKELMDEKGVDPTENEQNFEQGQSLQDIDLEKFLKTNPEVKS
ncbi:MAG: bifunctional nuclease family protein [Parcubacteria group bacterium]|nr:bifunctional nuclease family protein [Parcubacteria group bacterium]